MFDTNFISVLYFEWWARLPSAWLQVQSLLGVSEECLNLLSVSKNHHHIKRSRYTSHVKVVFRITWYFQRIPTLTARLHCTFKAKHVASFFHRAILHLKKPKKRYIKSCSSFKLAADGVVVWCFDHMLCVWQTTGRVQKKRKATSSNQSSPRQSTWKCLQIGATMMEKQERAAGCYTRSQMLLC